MGRKFFGIPRVDTHKIVHRTVAAAIVGGTVSKIGGGKFANGAITAAMVHLFNAEEIGKESWELRSVDAKPEEFTIADEVNFAVEQIANSPDGEITFTIQEIDVAITKRGNRINLKEFSLGDVSLKDVKARFRAPKHGEFTLDKLKGKFEGFEAVPGKVKFSANDLGIINITASKLYFFKKSYNIE